MGVIYFQVSRVILVSVVFGGKFLIAESWRSRKKSGNLEFTHRCRLKVASLSILSGFRSFPIFDFAFTDTDQLFSCSIAAKLFRCSGSNDMKTLTCKELGGKCDQKLSASTWDEMVRAMTKHVMEKHPDVAKQMEKMHNEDPKKWGKETKPKWDAAPET